MVEPTWEQRESIRFRMEELRRAAGDERLCHRKRHQTKQLFIAFWFGWHFGVRPGDINHMKWKNIVLKNGIPHLRFIPNKTKDTTNCEVIWPLSEDAFNQISGFVGKPEEFCLETEEKFVPRKNNRMEKNKHTYIWKTMNRFFREIGFDGWAGFYTLRYLSCQRTFRESGKHVESLLHGHSISVGQTSYYNRNDHMFSIHSV